MLSELLYSLLLLLVSTVDLGLLYCIVSKAVSFSQQRSHLEIAWAKETPLRNEMLMRKKQ